MQPLLRRDRARRRRSGAYPYRTRGACGCCRVRHRPRPAPRTMAGSRFPPAYQTTSWAPASIGTPASSVSARAVRNRPCTGLVATNLSVNLPNPRLHVSYPAGREQTVDYLSLPGVEWRVGCEETRRVAPIRLHRGNQLVELRRPGGESRLRLRSRLCVRGPFGSPSCEEKRWGSSRTSVAASYPVTAYACSSSTQATGPAPRSASKYSGARFTESVSSSSSRANSGGAIGHRVDSLI